MRAEIARAALLGTVAAAAFFTTPALAAQTAAQTTAETARQAPVPEATTAADNSGKDAATGEIIVTARRTEERLQRVPASVSAFNERALDRIQAQDTTGLQGAVPNLNIVQGRGSSNATNIFIRGIGQPDALQTFDPAVGVYVDDVYLSRIRGNQLDLLDVDRIEVLRGPQGTLYGKNTIGGAIKFITRRPGNVFRANGSIAAGRTTRSTSRAPSRDRWRQAFPPAWPCSTPSMTDTSRTGSTTANIMTRTRSRRAASSGDQSIAEHPHRPHRRLRARRCQAERRTSGQQPYDLFGNDACCHRSRRLRPLPLEGRNHARAAELRPR